jgi:hypothetical protein
MEATWTVVYDRIYACFRETIQRPRALHHDGYSLSYGSVATRWSLFLAEVLATVARSLLG